MLKCLIALTFLVQTAPLEDADDPSDREAAFRRMVDAGLEHYRARAFEEAAAQFLEAYDLIPEPELVYNAARSYEKALEQERAVEQYERFLRLKGTTAALRSKALDSLNQLRRELALENATPPPVPTAPVAVEAPEPQPARFSRAPEIALLSVGGASLIAGTVFGVLALEKKSDFDDATGSEREQLRDETEELGLLADVFLIAGGVTAATGIIMFLVRKPPKEARASWHPVIGPGSFGVAGRF